MLNNDILLLKCTKWLTKNVSVSISIYIYIYIELHFVANCKCCTVKL